MKKVRMVSDYTPLDKPNLLSIIRDDQGDIHIPRSLGAAAVNWKEATTQQLLLICSRYEPCHISEKFEAAAELRRRQRGKHERVQYKKKEVYPR